MPLANEAGMKAPESDQKDGTADHYARFTQAHTGKEPTLKLIQQGAMPGAKKRHGPRKRIGI